MYKVYIHHDPDCECPNDGYGWNLVSFNRRHYSFQDPSKMDQTKIQKMINDGRAYYLSYYEHGRCWWGLTEEKAPPGVEFQWDGVRVAGLLLWDEKEDPPTKESAKAFLSEYTSWANGECYYYEVYDEKGNLVDASGGFIGTDYLIEVIKELTQGKECEYIGEAAHIIS